MNCIRRSSGAPAEIAASGFTRVHEGSQYTINRIFTGEHLNPTLKNIRISGEQMITRVRYASERCLPEYERGFTRVYTEALMYHLRYTLIFILDFVPEEYCKVKERHLCP